MELARQLKAFGVQPKTLRIGDDTRKGYARADFEDAFSRYLPLPKGSKVGTTSQPLGHKGLMRSDLPPAGPGSEHRKPLGDKACADVPTSTP